MATKTAPSRHHAAKEAEAKMKSFIDGVIDSVEEARGKMTDEEREKADAGAISVAEELHAKKRRYA